MNVPLSHCFDYLPPKSGPCPVPGSRVRVPFGRRRETGLVMAVASDGEGSTYGAGRLKRADALLDEKPLLTETELKLIRFTSDYYHHPIGEVVAASLPALLRRGSALHPVVTMTAVTQAGESVDPEALGKRAPKQAALLSLLIDAGGSGLDADTLTETMPGWRRVSGALKEKGYIEQFEARAEASEPVFELDAEAGPELNAEQRVAVEAIQNQEGFGTFLLDGVTGSGKTEVYLKLIEDVLAEGRQTLLLVPEIGLTPQLTNRLRRRLGVEPALLHSGLTDLQRLRGWREARSGHAKLVVGTRSAVFAPLPELGLIVVDEEHDASLKQQEGLRYSARDLAIVRANRAEVPIVLGSATPTLEVLKHCEDGSYRHLELPRRAGGAEPPDVHIVDISRSWLDEGVSDTMFGAVETHLGNDGQVLLFLNRRGFAPTLICTACGNVSECTRCDARMTLHAEEGRLRCHHCGAERIPEEACSDCGSPLKALGAGTQRIEDALRRRFPERKVLRVDSDSTRRKGAMDEALTSAALGEAEILVGTQMLSKGHHFPKLTLVGVINADQGLFGTDFRSDERMAQSIVQVAGRAGREHMRGEVLVQTAFPEHPFWKLLVDEGYRGVASRALAERSATGWPPFSRLALIRAAAPQRRDAHTFLERARQLVTAMGRDAVRVLGPVDALMARRAGRYRAQLMLQSADRAALHNVLRQLRPALESEPTARKVRWSIDVDPLDLF